MRPNMRKPEDRKRLRNKSSTPSVGDINLIRLKGDLHALIHEMMRDAYMRAPNWQITSLEATLADIEKNSHDRKRQGHDQ